MSRQRGGARGPWTFPSGPGSPCRKPWFQLMKTNTCAPLPCLCSCPRGPDFLMSSGHCPLWGKLTTQPQAPGAAHAPRFAPSAALTEASSTPAREPPLGPPRFVRNKSYLTFLMGRATFETGCLIQCSSGVRNKSPSPRAVRSPCSTGEAEAPGTSLQRAAVPLQSSRPSSQRENIPQTCRHKNPGAGA